MKILVLNSIDSPSEAVCNHAADIGERVDADLPCLLSTHRRTRQAPGEVNFYLTVDDAMKEIKGHKIEHDRDIVLQANLS